MSRRDRKENKKNESSPKELTLKEKALSVLMSTVYNLINIIIIIFVGVLSVTHMRFTQTNLLPDCATAAPFTHDPVTPEQVHIDYISNKSSKGDMCSIKAYYPVNYNKKIINSSYLYKVIRILTTDPHSNVLGNYVGSIFASMAQSYASVYTSITSLFNSILPELFIFLFGIIFILVAHGISIVYTTILGVISFFTHANLFYYEKEIIELNKEQFANWKEGGSGMWDGTNIFYSLFIYFLLFMGLIAIIPSCSTFSLFMFLSISFTPFFLLRLYTSTKDIDKVIQKNANKMTFGLNNDNTGDETNMSGGGEVENDENDDNAGQSESGNASDDEGGNVNGQPHPNMPKRFTIISHLKKFVKVYRNLVLFVVSIMLIIDTRRVFGSYASGVTIFSIVLLWFFSNLYNSYKIKDSDKFTTFLLGTTQAEKECTSPTIKTDDTGRKWYFLWLM